MNRPISKRAEEEESVFKQWVSTVWRGDQGPLQNLFRLLPYASIPFLGIGSIIPTVLITVATHILKISPEDLGRAADKALGLGPGDDPRRVLPAVVDYFDNVYEKKPASYQGQPISKTAGIISGLLKVFGFGKVVALFITKIIAALASVFVFSHLGELTKKFTEPVSEMVTETTGWTGVEGLGESGEGGVAGDVEKEKNAEEFADYIEQKYGLK